MPRRIDASDIFDYLKPGVEAYAPGCAGHSAHYCLNARRSCRSIHRKAPHFIASALATKRMFVRCCTRPVPTAILLRYIVCIRPSWVSLGMCGPYRTNIRSVRESVVLAGMHHLKAIFPP